MEYEDNIVGVLDMHHQPAGPTAAPMRWLVALPNAPTVRAAWGLTDPGKRLDIARGWLHANRDHPHLGGFDAAEVAASLAAANFMHPLWDPFEQTITRKNGKAAQ